MFWSVQKNIGSGSRRCDSNTFSLEIEERSSRLSLCGRPHRNFESRQNHSNVDLHETSIFFPFSMILTKAEESTSKEEEDKKKMKCFNFIEENMSEFPLYICNSLYERDQSEPRGTRPEFELYKG